MQMLDMIMSVFNKALSQREEEVRGEITRDLEGHAYGYQTEMEATVAHYVKNDIIKKIKNVQ